MTLPLKSTAPKKAVRQKRSDISAARADTKGALIWCGTEILSERGFHVTGIDEVLKRTGTPKGSFYHFFESKHAFGEAVIDNYADYYKKKLDKLFNNSERAPLDRLRDFVEDTKRSMAKYKFKRGCLIGNLSQELASTDDDFRTRLEAILLSWEECTTACFREEIDRADLPSDTDPQAISRFFWIGWEGAILRAKLTRSTAPLDHFAECFFASVSPKPRTTKK